MEEKYHFTRVPYEVEAILGEYDAPENQEQGLVKYHFLKDGNTIIYGNDGIERELLLNILIYSSSKNYSANEINFYIIDYGSETLRRFQDLPHVGGMVFASEEDKFNNLIKLLKEEIEKRKKLFSEYSGDYATYNASQTNKLPIKVVIFNNYDAIFESHSELYDLLPTLVRDSERYGIIYIFACNGISSVSTSLQQNFSNIYAFRLKDSSDYGSLFGFHNRVIPKEVLGRGLLSNNGVHEFQTAYILPDGMDLNSYLKDFVSKQKSLNQEQSVTKIPILPEVVRFSDISYEFQGLRHLPIGISKNDLEIICLDLLSNQGFLISANKLNHTLKFIQSLAYLIRSIKNVNLILIDAEDALKFSKEHFPNYYVDRFDQILNSVIDYVQNQIDKQSQMQGVILIYGFNKFVTKIQDLSQFQALCDLVKKYEKIGIILVDAASKMKNYTFESWFSSMFSLNDGIWIGRGISNQNLFHLSNINREMTKDYKNDMGYVLNENMETLVRLIDFVSKSEEL